ncbi:MAG TPA: hypothetical protein VER08_06910 [Pyrinomonadaceae bacterium]|nr:hypothetical protein [Pyrinomonadaceae bacterium]
MAIRGNILKIVLSAAGFAFVLAAGPSDVSAQRRARGGADYSGPLVARAQSVTGDVFRVATRTPQGARVFARSEPRVETLQAVDRGLSELFAVARRNGYRARLNHADYTVFVARPDRVRNRDGQYSPDIAVGSAQYAGSVYDQGGYVYASGMVISTQQSAFIIAEHERDWHRVSDVARYEGEHLVLYHNDRRRYEATKDHSQGGGHPILQ